METNMEYRNFKNDKSIDELLYNVSQYKYKLIKLDEELRFYKFLIEANIFKPRVINLFERLTIFDKKMDSYVIKVQDLLSELATHANEISNKIECDNLECDAFFIKKQNKLELKSYNFIMDIDSFKSQMLQYLHSTIKNK